MAKRGRGRSDLLKDKDAKLDAMSSSDHDRLEDIVRDHVVGRVARLHGSNSHDRHDGEDASADTVFVEELIAAILETDSSDFERILLRLKATDAPLPAICDSLINPATEALGQMWVDDRETFMTVSVASARLQSLVNRLSEYRFERTRHEPKYRVLLGRFKGNNHTLGLTIVTACFREQGWRVDGGPDLEFQVTDVPRLVQGDHHVLGISVGTEMDQEEVSDFIQALSIARRNRPLVIGVGGPGVRTNASIFTSAGADFVALNARDAVFAAERGVENLSRAGR